MKKILMYIIICFITVLLIVNPEKSILYAKSAMDMCSDIIIPSLFPFFVCSGLLIYSGFCEVIARLFAPVMKPLFNINPSGTAAFILGIISGYPLGAATACQLYKGMYLSKTEAERLLAFCNNSGPLFIMSAVGISIYHSPKIGVILYAAHILGAVTVGILSRFYKPDSFIAPTSKINTQEKSISEIFSQVIANSLQSIITVCGTVIFCSVISNLMMDILPFNEQMKAVANGIMEFVSGLKRTSYLDSNITVKLIMSAWICAFAGISVHLQVMGVVGDSGLSLKPYVAGKILHGFFSALYTYVILKLVPVTQTVFSQVSDSQRLGGGFFVCALYITVTVLFLSSLGLVYIACKFRGRRVKIKNN